MESCCEVVRASNLRLIRHICGFAKCQPNDQKPGRLRAPVPPDQELNSYLMAFTSINESFHILASPEIVFIHLENGDSYASEKHKEGCLHLTGQQ